MFTFSTYNARAKLSQISAGREPESLSQNGRFYSPRMAFSRKDQSPMNKGKSRCGQISLANGFPVYFKSKATAVAMAHPDIGEGHADVSSAACEIYAAAQATFALLYLSYCSDEMGIKFEKPSVLEMDNKAAKIFADDTAIATKLRHIDQRQHWVKTLRDKNLIKAEHVGTKQNIADMFTKPLEGPAFRSIRDMFLHDCTDICVQGGISMLRPSEEKMVWADEE